MTTNIRHNLSDEIKKNHPNFDQNIINQIDKALSVTTPSYKASIEVLSAVFYQKIKSHIDGYPNAFNGNCGGISGMFGTYSSVGDVYTSDIENLFASTKTLMYVFTPIYCSVIWFDSSHTSIGSFQGTGFTLLAGSGGGTGSWSNG
jgi:hypothetical protein